MYYFIVFGVILLIIFAFIGAGDDENWEVVKTGKVTFAVLNGIGVVTIERHKLTKEVRAYLIEGDYKKSINVDYARTLIGRETSWLA